jgi:DNA polymerase III subunit delta'
VSILDVRFQDRAHRVIQRAFLGQRMPHAYIFAGPEGVGRELFARRLAQVITCSATINHSPGDGLSDWTGDVVDYCGACDSCRVSLADTHPDIHTVSRDLIKQHPNPEIRKRKGTVLGVDVVRHFLINQVGLKPAMGRAKVFIVREADTMSPGAQNALLKTLEEPPATTFLILIVRSADVMLPTTRSRCQVVRFGLLPADFIRDRLEAANDDISPDEARWCAAGASGQLGVAQRHYDDRLIEFQSRWDDLVANMGEAGVTASAKRLIEDAKALGERHQERDKDISDTEAQRRGLRTLFLIISMWYRDLLHHGVGAVSDATSDASGALAAALPPRRVTDSIQAVAAAERQLGLNTNVQLCVESLLVHLSRLMRI